MAKKNQKKVEEKLPKLTIRERLMSNQAEGLFIVGKFLPYFFGAWIAGGIILKEEIVFCIVTLGLLLEHFRVNANQEKEIIFRKEFNWLFIIGELAIIYYSFYITNNFLIAIVFAITLALMWFDSFLKVTNVYKVFLKALLVSLIMGALGVLGILSQSFGSKMSFSWYYLVIGLTPGFVLSSSLIVRNSKLFLDCNWERSRYVKDKKGNEVQRPGSLAQVYSLWLLTAPIVPVSLTIFGFFPRPFIGITFIYFYLTKLAQGFFEETKSDEEVGKKTIVAGCLLSLLIFICAELAKFNII